MQESVKSVLYFVKDGKILLLKERQQEIWGGVSISGDPVAYKDNGQLFRPDIAIGLVPMHTEKIAEQKYDDGEKNETIHAYVCDEWSGELNVPEGYEAEWFSSEDMPYGDMLPDRRLWLPLALSGTQVQGSYVVDESGDPLEHSVTPVEELEDEAPTSDDNN